MFFARRIYFINKRMQTRFILSFILVVACWALATVGVYMYLIDRKMDSIRYSSHVDITSTTDLLLPITAGTHVVSLLVFAAILAYAMRSVWKKLSPPLYSIKKDLARMASADLTGEVSLCRGEEFQDLAYSLEKMREGLRYNINQLKGRQESLTEATKAVEQSLQAGKLSGDEAATLKKAAASMREALQKFKI